MNKEWTIQLTPEQVQRERRIIFQRIPPEFQEAYMRTLGEELLELVTADGADPAHS